VSRDKPDGVPCRRGAVESSLFFGNCVHVNSVLDDGDRAVAELPRAQNHFVEGEAVWVHWEPADELHFE
jgi:hypothetical protein